MMNKIYPKLCWWFGHKHDHADDYLSVEYRECVRCGELLEYSDMVGDTRHNRFKDWCNYWLFRKWWPKKCPCCGGRWRHDETKDHIPF